MNANQQSKLLQKVLNAFVLSLLIATVGLVIGQFVPEALMLPLMIIEFLLILSAFWFRRRGAIGYLFLYVFTFISGITIFPLISHYLSSVGGDVVLAAFLTTVGIFVGMSIIGTLTQRDFSGLGPVLMIILIGIFIVYLVGIFIPFSSTFSLIIAGAGAILFSLYVMYDFNQMKHRGISQEDVPLNALNLYLDFVNLFSFILEILGFRSNND